MTEVMSPPAYLDSSITTKSQLVALLQANKLELYTPEIGTLRAIREKTILPLLETSIYKISLYSSTGLGMIEYTFDDEAILSAEVTFKFVVEAFRGKNVAQLLFSLCAEDLYSEGARKVSSVIAQNNESSLHARLNARKMLTGELFQTTYTAVSATPEDSVAKYLVETTL